MAPLSQKVLKVPLPGSEFSRKRGGMKAQRRDSATAWAIHDQKT
jgi:hypothetical protein